MQRPISTFAIAFAASLAAVATHAAEVKNIVIVHGALADSSGWKKATEILEKRGFNVTIVQQPITSLADDIAATNRVLAMQDGATLLVGHSYGGVVITEAGHNDKVAGLVYVAAFQPDRGESLLTLASSKPSSGMNIRETPDGEYLYLDPAAFAKDFAADLPQDETAFMAKAQVFASKQSFSAKVGDPAWKEKKSWSIVATEDRSINPDLERDMARRAGSQITEIAASHAVFISQPEKVADVIEAAARQSAN
ncbi:alpha/beta hydrolase [Sinorhizobium sp. BG8]|uniref:alpha/beta hydrolase n=1 Tax=Sinorhizobium sp. BG8 TaxID=2613773 RepID=UPI00193DE81B|nr:alpha/beta hydrolase [Sinorhizobium sp. BG8]QRM57056.1 alpha/beta hydrolase [Sinorhizobium sp. BG8]